MKKKTIYYKWGSNSDDILIPQLKARGYELTFIDTKCKDYTRDMSLAQEFILKINEIGAESVFSYDYFPILSLVCDTCKIPYYSWVYDSPHFTLYAKTTSLDCNRIGVFDRGLVEHLHDLGIENVFHKPLAVDPDFFAASIAKCKKDYSCDISFVGSLYTDAHEYYGALKNNDAIWKHLDSITSAQAFEYERNTIVEAPSGIHSMKNTCSLQERMDNIDCDNESDAVTEINVVDYLYGLMENHGLTLGDDYIQDKAGLVYDAVLGKHVTVLERRRLLEAISTLAKDKKYDFRLYTGSVIPKGSNLIYPAKRGGGYIDYISQMPSVFSKSRININITLKTIRTGIPLRALDILACGGFLLTDPQEELYEYFSEGEEFEAYRSIEECLEKIDFYLNHEEARSSIAQKGYEKCSERFALKHFTL